MHSRVTRIRQEIDMGYYINPPDGDKDGFLAKHGLPFSGAMVAGLDFDGPHLPVCLVDNGMFKAAAIDFDWREAQYFADDTSGRPQNGSSSRKRSWNPT